MAHSCQVFHGGAWVPAKVLLESKGGWKVFLYIGTGMETYVFNPQHIRLEEEV